MSVKTGKIFSEELASVNQLLPHKNKWAWDLYLKGQANNWSPSEVPMGRDIEQWRDASRISGAEKLLVKRCLGFFAGSESLVANNLLLAIFRVVSDPECRQYIIRQCAEEAIHNHTVVYVCDSLGLDVDEVYEAHKSIPAIKAKDDFLIGITTDMARGDFDLSTTKAKQEALRNIIGYYIICEGIFFYSGFAMLLSFGRQNKLPGICEQIQYTLRDESIHLQFGVRLINTIVEQEPKVWTKAFKDWTISHIKRATELEIAYAEDVLPSGILGLNSGLFVQYMQFIANRRTESIGLDNIFSNTKNPFNWLAETIDLPKQKNFFETRVTEYSVGSLVEDF